MAAVSQFLAVTFYLFALYAWESKKEFTAEDPIVDAIEEIVQKYEDSLSLYDLMAHFPIDEEINCPETDTRMPYPGDCTRYITCRDFNAHIRGCPPGMNFDPKALHCRFVFQTPCNGTHPRNEICGLNEAFTECGPKCEKSCQEEDDDYRDCSEGCVRGCFCKEGFVRGPLRVCIPPRRCSRANSLEPWFLIAKNEED